MPITKIHFVRKAREGLWITAKVRAGDHPLSYSAAMRRGGSRPTWQSCSFRDWHHIGTVGFLRELNHRGHKLIQAAGSHEPATTIRTPSEMESSVSMGDRNIACVVPCDIPRARCFHHRNTCHCCACWISGAYHACQRQGCELKKLIIRVPTRRGELRRISLSCRS